MSNPNFNKQTTNARQALSIGGITKVIKKLGKEIKKNPLPKKTKDIGKKFIDAFKSRGKKLSDNEKLLIKAKSRRLEKNMETKKDRKKLMGGGSSSSREAMIHGFYNKDMGMKKKKK